MRIVNEIKKYTVCIVITAIIVSSIWAVCYTKQLNQSGRVCNQLREQLADAENTNRRLGETVEQCQSICSELGESVDRSISTAREAIELIEEIRTEVGSLEVVCGRFSWDDYYQYWDNYFGIEK